MRRRWPCLVDDKYLVTVGIEVLVSEIFDELIAKGWARRVKPNPGSMDQVEWTELGLQNDVDKFDFNAALLERMNDLPRRRRVGVSA